jgi:hypothetical protein
MKFDQNQSLERILESAIVVSWEDLMHGAQTGLIHIEYNFAPDGTLEYLKVWTSIIRGHWFLVCDYWMSASKFHGAGMHFENGYQSETLAHILEVIMQHQDSFALVPNLGRQGLLQVPTPTQQESTAAAASMSEVFDGLDLVFDEPVAA